MKPSFSLICMFVVLGMIAGCNSDKLPKTVPAEGVVMLDGVLVSDATVLLIADTGNLNASAVSDKNGKFLLKAFDEKSGAVPGSYKVQISKTIAEPASERSGETSVNLKYGLPIKYSLYTTSGLTYKLGEEGDKNMKFDLTSK